MESRIEEILQRQAEGVTEGYVTPSAASSHAQQLGEDKPGIIGTVGDMIKGVGEGVVKAVEETTQFGFDVVNWFDDKFGNDSIADKDIDFIPDWLETKTGAGKLVSGVSQFLTGFAGVGKVMKLAKLGGTTVKLGKGAKYLQAMTQGALTDAVIFDPHEERLSNLLTKFPALENPITNYLAASPEDSSAEGRFKNALEGLLLGGLVDGLTHYVKSFKAARAAKTTDEAVEALSEGAKHIDESLTALSNKQATDVAAEKTGKTLKDKVFGKKPQTARMKELDMSFTDELPRKERLNQLRIYKGDDPSEVLSNFIKAHEEGIKPDKKVPHKLRPKFQGTEEGKSLLQAFNETDRVLVPASTKTTRTWKEAVEGGQAIIAELSDSKGVLNYLSKTADNLDKLDEVTAVAKMSLDEYGTEITRLNTLLSNTTDEKVAKTLIDQCTHLIEGSVETASYFNRIATSEGRALNMMKNVITLPKEQQEYIRKVITTIKGKSLHEQKAIVSRIAVATSDPVKFTRLLIPDTKSGKFWALHNELWINTVLSGVTTHGVNAISNGLKAAVFMPLDKLAGGWGGFKGGLFHLENPELWEEGVRSWVAMFHTVKDAWKMSMLALKTGDNVLKSNTVVETTKRAWSAEMFGKNPKQGIGKAIETLGSMINLPTRFLMASDEFFSQLTYRSKTFLHLERVARDAAKAGKIENTAEAIAQFIKDNFDAAFLSKKLASGEEIRQGVGVFKEALEAASEATFTQPLRDGSFGKQLTNMAHTHPWLTPIVPFIRTPLNILKDVGQHTPFIARHMDEFTEAMKQGGKAAALAEGRIRVGGLAWTAAIMAAANGTITGGGPKNKVHRDALEATGWKPYSIKIGDKYINYNRIDPLGMFLGVAADYAEIAHSCKEDDADFSDIILGMIFALPKNLTSKTYLKGLSDSLSAITDPERNAEWVLRQRALSYIPALLTQSRRVVDPELHEVSTMIGRVKDSLPFFSANLPTRYSWLTGKPVVMQGAWASGISPIVFSTGEKGKELIGQELGKYHLAVTAPSKTWKGVKLNDSQVSELYRLHGTIKLNGRTLEEALIDLFNSPVYDKERKMHPDDTDIISGHRPKLIRNVVEKYRKAALKKLLFDDRSIREALHQARRKKALDYIRSY